MPKQEKHIHTYERHPTRRDIYRCIDPSCSHYINITFLLGKEGLCPNCHQKIILTHDILGVTRNGKQNGNNQRKRPLGLCCRKSKKAIEFQTGRAVVENVLSGLFQETEEVG